MKEIKITNVYAKEYKKVCQNPAFNLDTLNKYISLIRTGQKNELCRGSDSKYPQACLHKMASNSRWRGYYNFHLAPNIVILFREDATNVYLERIGSHQDLNLTEST